MSRAISCHFSMGYLSEGQKHEAPRDWQMPMGRLNAGQCTPQRPPSHYCPQPAITTFQSSQTL